MGWGAWGHFEFYTAIFLYPPLLVASPFPYKGGPSIVSLVGHIKLTLFYSSLKQLVIESFWLALMP